MADESSAMTDSTALEDYGSISKDDKAPIIDEDQLGGGESLMPPSGAKYDPTSEKGCYFRDGQRRIDYVLVYEEDMDNVSQLKEESSGTPAEKKDLKKMSKKEKHDMWREKFMANLKKAGLEIEEETVEGNKKMIYYIKLHAPWDVLCFHAEDLCMRAPLQAHPNPSMNWSSRAIGVFRIPNIMDQNVPNEPMDYYTCQFKTGKVDRFLGSSNQMTYFQQRDRQRIVYEILSKACYGKRKRAEIGIDRLIDSEIYTAAFPLHDGTYELPKDPGFPLESLNPRQVLYKYWARWGTWYKYQPLDHIREYFGEKIGIYFAWLGFYTAWLLPASFVGLFVFLYGVITMNDYTPSKEVCNSGREFKMCPLCDEEIGCEYWYLSDVCLFTRLSYLFDHPGTVFYAVFVSFWAVTFLEYWKRKSASISHHWDCSDFEEEEERPRPEYAAMAPCMEKNPITGIKEPYFPKSQRLPRIVTGVAIILVMIVLVIIFIIAVIMYRVLISIPLFQNDQLRSIASTTASMSAAVVNLILIMALGKVYETLAVKLTQWEMHRTQSEYDDQLVFKTFIFQFVNFYSSIIYIGFFKGRFTGHPGAYTHFFGLRNEECQNGGCLIELAMQLGVIMIGKQAINNAQELFVPKLKAAIHKWKMGDICSNPDKARWEEDYELIEDEGLFPEYLEMVLQFGFITIFVAAFPLAPLFALLNNWIEIRLDAHKFVCETRRPVAERAQNIGVWFIILDALAQLAVISNAFLIAFTSEFLPRLVYKYKYDWDLTGYVNFTLAVAPVGTPGLTQECRYKDYRDESGEFTIHFWHLLCIRFGFVIIFEHVVFGVCRLIDLLVPDVPESLELKIKRERYLAKQALADTDAIMKMYQLARKEEEEEDNEDVAVKMPPDQA